MARQNQIDKMLSCRLIPTKKTTGSFKRPSHLTMGRLFVVPLIVFPVAFSCVPDASLREAYDQS